MIQDQPVAPSVRGAAKWGGIADAGFQILPDALLFAQSQLGLTAPELVVLLNLTAHWWFADQLPFPRPTAIASRMNVNVRTVQRALHRLEQLGLIESEEIVGPNKKRTIKAVNFDGLIRQLKSVINRDPRLRTRSKSYRDAVPRNS